MIETEVKAPPCELHVTEEAKDQIELAQKEAGKHPGEWCGVYIYDIQLNGRPPFKIMRLKNAEEQGSYHVFVSKGVHLCIDNLNAAILNDSYVLHYTELSDSTKGFRLWRMESYKTFCGPFEEIDESARS
jgi:hypothetical protein